MIRKIERVRECIKRLRRVPPWYTGCSGTKLKIYHIEMVCSLIFILDDGQCRSFVPMDLKPDIIPSSLTLTIECEALSGKGTETDNSSEGCGAKPSSTWQEVCGTGY